MNEMNAGTSPLRAWVDMASRRLFLDRQIAFWTDVLAAPSTPGAHASAAPTAAQVSRTQAPSMPTLRLTLARSGRTVALDGEGTLLEQLERAGERPRSRCRMGLCGTCRCALVSGAATRIDTGVTSSEPGDEIRLCVSRATGELVVDL